MKGLLETITINYQVYPLVLADKEGNIKCPYCSEKHKHGKGDGHRLSHCANNKSKSIITVDGVLFEKSEGYYVKYNRKFILSLAIGHEENIPEIEFDTIDELYEYIEKLKEFDCVWAVGGSGMYSEEFISDDIDNIIKVIKSGVFELDIRECIHIFQYKTYEDAFRFVLELKEGHEKRKG